MFSMTATREGKGDRNAMSRRRVAKVAFHRLGALVAALALMGTLTGVASATVGVNSNVYTNAGMDLQCFAGVAGGSGKLVAYAPDPRGVFSSFPSNRIYVSMFVDRWDGYHWVSWDKSKYNDGSTWEWAYGNSYTLAFGQRTWYPLLYTSQPGVGSWVNSIAGGIFSVTSPSITFVEQPGYYRVSTKLRDARDGNTYWLDNTTADGTGYCKI